MTSPIPTIRALLATSRGNLYRLLATVFAAEPSAAFSESLRSPKVRPDLESLEIDFAQPPWTLASPEERTEALAVEYASLFLVPGRMVAPFESVQRGEGRYWGDGTVAVKQFYETYGYQLSEPATMPPDHLSTELEFLGHLVREEANAARREDRDAVRDLRRIQRQFLTEHLVVWIAPFAERVSEAAEYGYYREFAALTRGFVESELADLTKPARRQPPHLNPVEGGNHGRTARH